LTDVKRAMDKKIPPTFEGGVGEDTAPGVHDPGTV
jgi:hypothetical protein